MAKKILVSMGVLLICACASVATWARPVEVRTLAVPVNIAPSWKFQAGDDPAWAAPEFDESGWQTVNLTDWFGQNQYVGGFAWYRLRISISGDLSPAERETRIGMALGGIEYSAYEIFVNGQRIGQFGEFPPNTTRILPARPQVFAIPWDVVQESENGTGNLVIAARVWRDPRLAGVAREFGTPSSGSFLVGAFDVLAERVELERWRARGDHAPRIFLALVFVLVGLYHLQLFNRRHQLKEYLWFGLLAISAAINISFLSNWADYQISQFHAYVIGISTIHFNCIAWFEFCWLIFGWKRGRLLLAYEMTQVGLILLTLFAPRFAVADMGLWPVILTLPVLWLWIGILPYQAWKGHPEARTICWGLSVLAAARFYHVLMAFDVVENLNFVHWGFAALLLSIAVSLSNRFSRVYGELDTLNQDLESKVAERTDVLGKTVEQLRVSEQEALKAREEAIEANQAKSLFLANMSHELRTPLNAILGFVQLMKRSRRLDDENRENLDIISRSGEHLLTLINDVLSISKIEAGHTSLHIEALDLRRMLSSLERTFHLRAEHKGLAFVCDVSDRVPRYVLGDEGKVRQILINLLGNATKFTDAGHVALRVRWVEGRAFFEVEDTGVGIEADEIGTLFEPFTQTRSGRRAKEGTGLGLAISRNFARLMGGDITVQSAPHQGSTFFVEIVLPETGGVPTKAASRVAAHLQSGQPERRILVVDDVLENRRLLVRLLEAVGFVVRSASNGREAVASWREWHPHFIWMDVRMPEMDGTDATRIIREEEQALEASGQAKEFRTVIVALTASAFEQDRDMVIAAGCDDFVVKPFQEAELFQKMVELLGVSFDYEESEVPGDNALDDEPHGLDRMTVVPEDLRAVLRQAMLEGDVEGANQAAELIAGYDETLAAELRRLVRGYRFDDILGAIGRAETR